MKSVLTIAGSDSSGGAGIQADLKTIAALGLYGQSAITALTAQNTLGVTDVHSVDAPFVQQQIDAVYNDIRPAAVKIGMISCPEVAKAIAASLKQHEATNIVLDPVMVATSGAELSTGDTMKELRASLFPMASVLTPNYAEAEALARMAELSTTQIIDDATQEEVARNLSCAFGVPVLVKGGHGAADANDVLALNAEEVVWYKAPKISNANTHGTGCTLSSAIACGLAYGLPLEEAVALAKSYLSRAIAAKLNLGKGRGPLNHFPA